MKAIETRFGGHRFRSRTEAKWAVFFSKAGIKYDYEPQGFVVEGKPYLPDFWLPEAKMWFEVKGEKPTEAEEELCCSLYRESGFVVLLAVGAPDMTRQITAFSTGESGGIEKFGPYNILNDRRNDGEFWLASPLHVWKFISVPGSSDHERWPVDIGIGDAYRAAQEARFEHGEKP